MQNDVELLDIMLKDQLNQKDLYHPSPYWKGYSSRTAKAIRSDGLQNFRTNSRIGKGYADTVLMNPFDRSSLDSWMSKIIKSIIQLPFFSRRFIDPFVKLIKMQSVDLDISQGKDFKLDMEKRLINALNDVNYDNSKVLDLIDWVEKNMEYFPVNIFSGVEMLYMFQKSK